MRPATCYRQQDPESRAHSPCPRAPRYTRRSCHPARVSAPLHPLECQKLPLHRMVYYLRSRGRTKLWHRQPIRPIRTQTRRHLSDESTALPRRIARQISSPSSISITPVDLSEPHKLQGFCSVRISDSNHKNRLIGRLSNIFRVPSAQDGTARLRTTENYAHIPTAAIRVLTYIRESRTAVQCTHGLNSFGPESPIQ